MPQKQAYEAYRHRMKKYSSIPHTSGKRPWKSSSENRGGRAAKSALSIFCQKLCCARAGAGEVVKVTITAIIRTGKTEKVKLLSCSSFTFKKDKWKGYLFFIILSYYKVISSCLLNVIWAKLLSKILQCNLKNNNFHCHFKNLLAFLRISSLF